MIDVPALHATIWGKVATDTEGAGVRALLGSSTSMIPHPLVAGTPLPVRPLIAFRRLPVAGRSDDIRALTWIWYVYDDPPQMHYRIGTIVNALQNLYTRLSVPLGELDCDIGGDDPDHTLNLNVTLFRLYFYRRG